jgi:hypothetical protein
MQKIIVKKYFFVNFAKQMNKKMFANKFFRDTQQKGQILLPHFAICNDVFFKAF